MAGQPFTNLVRFADNEGKILWGDASPENVDKLVGSTVTILDGHPFDGGLTRTGKTAIIKKVYAHHEPEQQEHHEAVSTDRRDYKRYWPR